MFYSVLHFPWISSHVIVLLRSSPFPHSAANLLYNGGLRIGIRGEQISSKAANAPISAITVRLLLLLLTALQKQLVRTGWQKSCMQPDYSFLKCSPQEDTGSKKKSFEVVDFGSLQERGPIESFEESKRSSYIPI